MPLYDFKCLDCGKVSELLIIGEPSQRACPACGSLNLEKLLSKTSSLTGKAKTGGTPGPGDTTCCGSSPSSAGCAGPGSCCGRR
ncbi:FmdB family zinc ribbon protein [Dethiosulfatarculus sandiegensis]|uniref:FmdB family transcriptional regulator n=1 Tax=Dethiosulfatarculus sandiegensis TaxID=1429043 RepID=A0A0D2K0X5_9BACT|nr:zinc ribbon domain-containing protein [Dethiosulfatarculus sandiegensis]KIX15370.1 FmdB family transcriptional regulator [Dethiosulfatarculus sandiegensis]